MVHSPTSNGSLPSTDYGCLIKRKHRHRIRRPTGDSSSNQSPPRYLRPVFSYETERASSRHPDVKAETSAYLTGKALTSIPSQDPVNKVVPGRLGTGLNPFILFFFPSGCLCKPVSL